MAQTAYKEPFINPYELMYENIILVLIVCL